MKRSRGNNKLLGPLTALVTVLFLSALLEFVVRAFLDDGMNFNIEMWKYARDIKQRSADPLIGHEHRPNARSLLMGVEVATNSHGHRDREIPVERQPSVGRVVMLGDSFIEGWGVRFEETISKRLEYLFQRDARTVEVMNTGVGNYNTVMEVRAFLTRDRKFEPDVVVLNYTFNDAEPVPSYGSPNFILQNSEAAVYVAGSLDSLFRQLHVRRGWEEYYLGLYETPGWSRATAAIHDLAEYCRANRIRLLLASWPELHDIENYKLGKVTDRLREVARSERLPFVDLLDALKGEKSSKLWVTPPDPHPNGYANLSYATYLFPFVLEELRRSTELGR